MLHIQLVKKTRGLLVSTFHTLGFDIIKQEYKHLGFKANTSLFDEYDQMALLKEITADLLKEDKELLQETVSAISLVGKMILFFLNKRSPSKRQQATNFCQVL